ncbi:MAG: kinase [Thermoproteota archaeon]|nr:kinase [Thermoproteota archaeon]
MNGGEIGVEKIKLVKKKEYPQLKKLHESFDISEDSEVCLAVGGDGTFLEAAREFKGPILPIRGGEKDSLGFHADFTVEDIDEIISELKQNSYTVEEYSKLKITCKGRVYNAVNDVVLFRASPKSVHCKVYYWENGERKPLFPKDLKGDGVVFSGQIGSTAYNFFAGGPIIHRADVIIVTPLSANYNTSIVSEGEFCVEVTKSEGSIEYDGFTLGRLVKGEDFTVGKSTEKIKVIHLRPRESFSEKLVRLHLF